MIVTEIEKRIITILHDISEDQAQENGALFSSETPLVGPDRAIKSRMLVELLLELEEFTEQELGFEFDWASDSAMSEKRSIYRTIHTLAAHLATQQVVAA